MSFIKAFAISMFFMLPATLSAAVLKEPKNPDGPGQFAQCMKQEDYAKCREISLSKMQIFSEALSYVHTHNKALKHAGSSKRKPLKVHDLSEKFEKWYTRYVVLTTSSFYKNKL